MKEIIKWCNLNTGFISAILSLMTIIVSMLAIIISRRITSIPYKKKLMVEPFCTVKKNEVCIQILIVNNGFATIVINNIYIENNKKEILGMPTMKEPLIIQGNQYKKMNIKIKDEEHIEFVKKNALNLNNKIRIDIRDMDGKKYIFKNKFPVG